MSVSRWIGRIVGLFCLVLAATVALAETIVSPETQGQLGFENGALVVRPGASAAEWALGRGDEGYVLIRNVAADQYQYLHVENGPPALGPIAPDWWSAQWTIEPAGGLVRFKNRWTGAYLHLIQGQLGAVATDPNTQGTLWQLGSGATAAPARVFPETYRSPVALPDAVTRGLSAQEQLCFDSVNGRIAWNRAGSTQWGERNILTLCEGTSHAEILLTCFQSEVQRTDDWQLAVMACKNAEASLRPATRTPSEALELAECIRFKMSAERLDPSAAIAACQALYGTPAADPSKAVTGVLPTLGALEQICFDAVQGKVAWDQLGSTQWLDSNVRLLCDGTPNPEWTVSCFQSELVAQGYTASFAVSACRASNQALLGKVIPPRQSAPRISPAGVDIGELCTQVVKCGLDYLHGSAPASICNTCGSGPEATAAALQRLVQDPDFGTACAAANEVRFLKDMLTGGFQSAASLVLCQVAGRGFGLGGLCNGACSANCARFGSDRAQYEDCQLKCGCGYDKIICDQGTEIFAAAVCEVYGLR